MVRLALKRKSSWILEVLILAVSLLTHGLLLISDFTMWDGWMLERLLAEERWDSLMRWHSEIGMPLLYYFKRLFMIFPNPNYSHKATAFLSITFSALVTFRVLNQTGLVGSMEALLIALFSLTFPAFRVAGERSVSHYLFCYLLFLGATCLAFEAESQTGWKRTCLRIGTLAGFFLSFYTGSLLVFYSGFFITLMLCEQRRCGQRLFSVPWKWLLRRADYIGLPFVFWSLKITLTPTHGLFKGYNMPVLSVKRLLDGYQSLIFDALLPSFKQAFFPSGARLVVIAVVLLLLCALSRLYRLRAKEIFSATTSTDGMFGFGLLLMLLATLPYIAVGTPFGSYGLATRTLLLIPIPSAIILLAFLRRLFYDSDERWSRWLFPVIVFILFGFTTSYIKTYVSWQAMGVKDRSVLHNLSHMKEAQDYSIIEVRNEFIIPETVDCYAVAHWTYQLSHAFGDVKRLAFETRPEGSIDWGGSPKGRELYTEKELMEMIVSIGLLYELRKINLSGKQGILTIRRGTRAESALRLAMRYWFYKIFKPDEMDAFLKQVTSLELKPRLEQKQIQKANCNETRSFQARPAWKEFKKELDGGPSAS